MQASPAAIVLADIANRFGSRDLAVILARITRGLMLASAVEERLVHTANRPDTGRTRRAVASGASRNRAARVPEVSHQEDDAALLARLPTARDIAARLRGKPIGAVLEQICHDLGITCEHPLWPELQEAILANGGSVAEVLNDMMMRVRADYAAPLAGLPPAVCHPTQAPPRAMFGTNGTGPP